MARFTRLLEEAVEQVRALARGLRPVENTPDGLVASLRRLIRDLRVVQRKDVRFVCRRPVLVRDILVATHLFRIAQEAVNNAVKHAGCKRIRITLADTPERLLLAVKDDGVGLRRARSSGIGLHVMHYRAHAIRGSLVIQSAPGRGTEVVCSVAHDSVSSNRTDVIKQRK